MSRFFVALFVAVTLSFSSTPAIKKQVDIGIISIRPIDENQKIWSPFVQELRRLEPHYDYRIHSYTEANLEKAVAANQLDFIIVHPLSLITMETKYEAQNIASLIRKDDAGNLLNHYGSVIVTKANNSAINTLKDLRGKTIATTHKEGFAVYLMPLELLNQNGIDMLSETNILFTGQPQDLTLAALRSDKADVAFFRSGYIEELIAKGKLNPQEFKVIHPQKPTPEFHYLRSTPLYPEWAVAATKRADTAMIKDTTIALYRFTMDTQKEYHSFSNPLSYKSTRDLMQKYHIYPFDQTNFTLQDVIDKYSEILILLLSMITIAGGSFTLYYIISSRKNRLHSQEIQTILSTASDGIHVHDMDGNLLLHSDSFAAMLGYSNEEIAKLKIYDWDHYFQPEDINEVIHHMSEERITFETKHTKKDGNIIDVEITAKKMFLNSKPCIYASSRDITNRKQTELHLIETKERLDNLAHHDPLTQLPNRLSLIELLKEKTVSKIPFALLFLDLDGFKEINDSYGHRFGDNLLIQFAALLKTTFPPETYIVRPGGDEFVLLLDNDNTAHAVEIILLELLDKLNRPFSIDTIDIYITASIGIAFYPHDAISTEELLQNADAAMYDAKKMGKNTFSFYSVQLTETVLQKTTLATHLKKAITAGELELYYQPQVDPRNGKIVGVEALLRWFSAEGAISPGIFVPLAEENGIIVELGNFVLTEGLKHARKWKKANLLEGRVAINVSARQLTHLNFLNVLENAMRTSHCKPEWIELEITESSILDNPNKIISLLEFLKTKGFHISIDDFGTGYSSLSYLKNLPVDKLKIDQSFIRDIEHEPKNKTIVTTIISLAKGLGMEVLAEGVETSQELDFLRFNHIDSIQGFYYYQPLPAEKIDHLLQNQIV